MTIVTAPDFNELKQVCDFADSTIDMLQDEVHNGTSTDGPSAWERECVSKTRDWIEALENLDAENQAKLAVMTLDALNSSIEIQTTLILSTSHIERDTADTLQAGLGWGLIVHDKGDYGWTIHVPYNVVEHPGVSWNALPPGLLNCITRAQVLGCTWVCLDQDGPELAGLETFEW